VNARDKQAMSINELFKIYKFCLVSANERYSDRLKVIVLVRTRAREELWMNVVNVL
jgi:hypothetical protein